MKKFKALMLPNSFWVESPVSVGNIIKDLLYKGSSRSTDSYFTRITDSKNEITEEYLLVEWIERWDKNGRELYEGDYVMATRKGKSEKGLIIYDSFSCSYLLGGESFSQFKDSELEFVSDISSVDIREQYFLSKGKLRVVESIINRIMQL